MAQSLMWVRGGLEGVRRGQWLRGGSGGSEGGPASGGSEGGPSVYQVIVVTWDPDRILIP